MKTTTTTAPPRSLKLVGAQTCLELVFQDPATRPCLRFFRGLQNKRLIPWKKIGRRAFFDPVEVRNAIDRQFSVNVLTR